MAERTCILARFCFSTVGALVHGIALLRAGGGNSLNGPVELMVLAAFFVLFTVIEVHNTGKRHWYIRRCSGGIFPFRIFPVIPDFINQNHFQIAGQLLCGGKVVNCAVHIQEPGGFQQFRQVAALNQIGFFIAVIVQHVRAVKREVFLVPLGIVDDAFLFVVLIQIGHVFLRRIGHGKNRILRAAGHGEPVKRVDFVSRIAGLALNRIVVMILNKVKGFRVIILD